MSAKKIISIGFDIASDDAEYISFDSKISLLDWDIIIFFPDISFYYELTDDTFQGKPALSETFYVTLKQLAEHWRREILTAFNSNKTIIIILNELQEIYIDSGERKYSEADSASKVTRLFDSYSNYDSIPLKLKPVNITGKSMKLAKNSEIISGYWKEFSHLSEYKVIIEGKLTGPLVLTEEEKMVGAYAKNKSTNGAIILLPFLNFNKDISLGQKFLESIVEIDEVSKHSVALIDKISKQPPDLLAIPNWVKDSQFELPKEIKYKRQLLKIDSKIKEIQQEKEKIKSEILQAGFYKRLLYEKGKALERAILNSLKLLGFESLTHRDSEPAFDMVFQSEQGRFIGQVEGKDNEAIGFEKLKQLAMNILEDYAREEVDNMAKGILFGNAYRLQEINTRSDFFTTKCVIAATRNRIALVRTPDLFGVVKYLSDNNDINYAKKCREAILQSEGEIVTFPEPPKVINSLKDT